MRYIIRKYPTFFISYLAKRNHSTVSALFKSEGEKRNYVDKNDMIAAARRKFFYIDGRISNIKFHNRKEYSSLPYERKMISFGPRMSKIMDKRNHLKMLKMERE
jgi:hypothetical protein